jgi:hypothetical protein
MLPPSNGAAATAVRSSFSRVVRVISQVTKGKLKRAMLIATASLLSACGDQPKLTWEYPVVGSSSVVFKICHVDKGQTQEVCRDVENPQLQAEGGEKFLYTVPLTRSELKAQRIGVMACREVCGPETWKRLDVK